MQYTYNTHSRGLFCVKNNLFDITFSLYNIYTYTYTERNFLHRGVVVVPDTHVLQDIKYNLI